MSYLPDSALGDVQTNIDYTPGAADISYSESGGVLSGAGGVFHGWKVANWGLTNSLAESNANNNIAWSANISSLGQKYAYYYQDWINNVPQIYKEVKGDFELIAKFKANSGGNDNQRSPAIYFGVLDDDGTFHRTVSFETLGWSTADFKPTVGMRFVTGVAQYQGSNIGTVWLKLKRVGDLITWSDSTDGSSYTERISRKVDPGNVGRLGFGFGGDGGTDVRAQIEYIKASFYEI